MKNWLAIPMLCVCISVINPSFAQCPYIFEVDVIHPRNCNTNFSDGSISITPTLPVQDIILLFNNNNNIVVQNLNIDSLTITWNRPELNGNLNPTNLSAGDYKYTITYTSADGDTPCIVVGSVLLTAEPLTLSCQALLNEDQIPRIVATMNGGIPPYKLFWVGPISGSHSNVLSGDFNIDGLPYGTYNFELRDSAQCGAFCEVTIAPDCDVKLALVAKNTPNCSNSEDGSIEVAATGGQGLVVYKWNTGQIGPIINNLIGGSYTVIAADELGCRDTLTVVLEAPASVDLICEVINGENVMKGGGPGSVSMRAYGGSPPFQLQWLGENASGNMTLTLAAENINLPTGFYTFEVTDSKGCTDNCVVAMPWEVHIDANEDVVVEYLPDTEVSVAQEIHAAILEHARATDSCWYYNDFYRIYQYHTLAAINLSDQGVKTPVKVDTSDLKNLIFNPIDITNQNNDFCVYSAGDGNKQRKVVVAVIDSGMDLISPLNTGGHPQLDGINWTNPNETLSTGQPKDDDGNQLMDDLDGYDYVNHTNKINDALGHGTHLAGIIANAFPGEVELDLINMKVKDVAGGNVFDLACAINYAIDEGADVINLSLGYYSVDYYSPLYSALQRARDSLITVVVSAGNEGRCLNGSNRAACMNTLTRHQWVPLDTLRWPVAFKSKVLNEKFNIAPLDNIIVVAALDTLPQKSLAAYSNVGASMVDVAAQGIFKSTYLNDGYKTMAGTSMAAADVSRLIALMKAYRPEKTPLEIINAITSTCDIHNTMNNLLSSGGCVNAENAFINLGINPALQSIKVVDNGSPGKNNFIYSGENPFRGRLKITLGNGQKYYRNVEMVISKQLAPNEVVFRKKYCEINIINWDGTIDNGKKIGNGTYWVTVFVNGEEITSSSRSIKLVVP